MKKFIKTTLLFILLAITLVGLIILITEWRISAGSKDYIYDDLAQLPDSQVVLVLGTSKYLGNGQENLFYTFRMDAAKQLYDAGKARAFIVSGDNRAHNYNEPAMMRKSLVGLGIPTEMIYSDYAGFRTLDSVVRTNKVFGQDTFIIVSQKFHNQRAVFIARHYGLQAYGYNARAVSVSRSYKTFIRERFARVKVFLDIMTNKGPYFLGDPIDIDSKELPQ